MKEIILTNEASVKIQGMSTDNQLHFIKRISENNLNDKRRVKIVNGKKMYTFHATDRFNVNYSLDKEKIAVVDIQDRAEEQSKMLERLDLSFMQNIYNEEMAKYFGDKNKNKRFRVSISILVLSVVQFALVYVKFNSNNTWLSILSLIMCIVGILYTLMRELISFIKENK